MPGIEASFTPFYAAPSVTAMRRLGLLETTIGGHKLRSRCHAYLEQHGLDIDLDGMSGLELQKNLLCAANAPPIIFVTGNSDEGRRQRAIDMGCIAFLQKPVSSTALMQALEKAMADSAANN